MRTYSAEEKADALSVLAACGGRVKAAARVLRVPHRTLRDWQKGSWINAEVLGLMEETKRKLAAALIEEAHLAAGDLAGKRGAATYKDTLVGIGIAVDKALLLTGQPTQITAHAEMQVRGAYVMLVERFSREPWEAAAISGLPSQATSQD